MRRNIHRVLTLFSLLPTLLFSSQVWAWGATGHRTTGLIAEHFLNTKSKKAVEQLLGSKSLADVANWADEVRYTETYLQSRPYHTERIADGETYLENLRQGTVDPASKKTGPLQAILFANTVLRNPQAKKAEKVAALKFLVHFVGDIHQPLHSGRPEDVGGVRIELNWFGKEISLHKLWDRYLISTGHEDILKGLKTRQASEVYAKYLLERTLAPVVETLNVEDWLKEGIERRDAAYNKQYNTNQTKYAARNVPVVDHCIYSAGVRLADMLNAIFANEPESSKVLRLREKIEKINGPLEGVISFKP